MKLKRTTGLVLSLALLMIPATASLAKPTASHQIELLWQTQESGVTTTGSIQVIIDELGASTVRLQVRQSGQVVCAGGTDGQMSSVVSFTGLADLSTSVDRRLDHVMVSGEVIATESAVTTCSGSVLETSQLLLPVELTGSGIDRLIRSRDAATGSRFIERLVDVDLQLGSMSLSDQVVVTKEISKA